MRRIVLLLLSACGSGDDSQVNPDASVDGGVLDLATATWENTPIGVRPDTTALRPDMAITNGGEVIVVWADVLDSATQRSPILSASSVDGFAEAQLSPPGDAGYFRPAISAAGDRVHLVFSGPGGATNSDIFYSRRDGGTWSPAVNLTGPLDSDGLVDGDPVVVEAGGITTVLFLAHVFAPMTVQPDGLFAISFSDPGDPKTIETLLDPGAFSCSDVEAVTDGETIHAIVRCTESGTSGLYYLNDRSGDFVRQSVDLGASRAPITPDIALDPDGGVHLLWVGSLDCPSGTCRDVFHSRGLAPPVSITGQSEDGGFMPVLAVDRRGRVIAAFHRLGAVDDVLWTYAETAGGFVRTQLVTPGTAATTDWQPGAIEINPVTGRPHLAFLRSADGNSDIVHGELR